MNGQAARLTDIVISLRDSMTVLWSKCFTLWDWCPASCAKDADKSSKLETLGFKS